MFHPLPDDQRLSMALELKEEAATREPQKWPAVLLVLHRGAVVTMGGNSPLILRYPDFPTLLHYCQLNLDDYFARSIKEGDFRGMPETWGRGITMDGPV